MITRIYLFIKFRFEKMFRSRRDQIRVFAAITSVLPVIIVYFLGGVLELYDYVMISISIILFVGALASTLLDAIRDKTILWYKDYKRKKQNKKDFY